MTALRVQFVPAMSITAIVGRVAPSVLRINNFLYLLLVSVPCVADRLLSHFQPQAPSGRLLSRDAGFKFVVQEVQDFGLTVFVDAGQLNLFRGLRVEEVSAQLLDDALV